MNVFDYVNAINYTKEDLFQDSSADKDYVAFIVNRSLSNFPDTVLYANEMNKYPDIPVEWQFQFLRNSVSKRKRFSKWHKKPVVTEDVTAVSRYYKYSLEKALEVISMLSDEQLTCIKQQMDEGGKL